MYTADKSTTLLSVSNSESFSEGKDSASQRRKQRRDSIFDSLIKYHHITCNTISLFTKSDLIYKMNTRFNLALQER